MPGSKEACLSALGLTFADLFPERDQRDLGQRIKPRHQRRHLGLGNLAATIPR
jgi:hypothetical protein